MHPKEESEDSKNDDGVASMKNQKAAPPKKGKPDDAPEQKELSPEEQEKLRQANEAREYQNSQMMMAW